MADVFGATPRDTVAERKMRTPDPSLTMCRAAERAVMNCDATIVVTGSMNFATGRSMVLVALPYSVGCGPMALNTMSTRPAVATTWSRWRLTASSSRASNSTAAAVGPSAEIASATACTRDFVRPERNRCAPCAANSLATAAPTYPPAPKITALLPSSRGLTRPSEAVHIPEAPFIFWGTLPISWTSENGPSTPLSVSSGPMPKLYGQICAIARGLEVLGGRWTPLIVRELLIGPRRFTDIEGNLPGIPSSLLGERLRELETAGLVRKRRLPRPA